jgi:glutamine phosphoribosylpyrophosphate amidotransferase
MATGRAEDLLANKIEPEQFADYFGVNSFEALSLANLERSVMQSLGRLCTGCLDGNYPTNVPVQLTARK